MFILQTDEFIIGERSCNAELKVLCFRFLSIFEVILASLHFIKSKQSCGFEGSKLISNEAVDGYLWG